MPHAATLQYRGFLPQAKIASASRTVKESARPDNDSLDRPDGIYRGGDQLLTWLG
jgi:hypothetical protein